jgi:flagellar biosynthetic protein FliQ
MDITQVLDIGRDLLVTTLLISLPPLLASLLVGLVVSILQALTSIQEQTLSFVPRLIAVGLVLLLFLGWILQTGIGFTVRMLTLAAEVGR